MNNPRRGRGRSGRRPNIPTRSQNFDSNGPEGRVRGNAQQVYEKYQALARDAQSAGDRVLAEAFQQHGEHYFRVMNDSTDPDSRPRDQQGHHGQGHGQGQGQQSRDDHDGAEGDDDYRGDQRDHRGGDNRGDVRGEQRGDQQRGDQQRSDQRGGDNRGGDNRGERRGQDRDFDRRDDQRIEQRGGDNRSEARRDEEPRPNGQGRYVGSPAERAPAAEPAAAAEGAAPGGRDGEPRENRMRDRLNRRNGDGILTRRRGEEPREVETAEPAREEEPDAGLRKMLGGAPAPRPEPAAPETAADEGPAEATEAAPAKPRRRRRTKAEIEADKAKLAD